MKETYRSENDFLLSAVRHGDQKAFDTLFRKYYPMLCAYGHRFVDLEDADTTANGEDTRVEVKTGKEVVLVAPEREGFRFNHWEVTSGTVGLIDADKTTAYFTMKSENVRIKAIYDEYHTITMVDGKGTAYDADGKEITSAVVGDKITIVAKDRDSHEFNHWEIDPDNVILEDPNADKTAFTMPDEPVSVEAKYKHLQSITMNHGTAYDEDFSETDIAKAKQTITIKADNNQLDNRYIKEMKVNGKSQTRNFLTHDQLIKGANIQFQMSPVPNKQRGTTEKDVPYSLSFE